jgi:hypothetical protein
LFTYQRLLRLEARATLRVPFHTEDVRDRRHRQTTRVVQAFPRTI